MTYPLIVAWPLKRSVIARLQSYASGVTPVPPGAELLASGDPAFSSVQVSMVIPAEPDRLSVFGAPLRLSRLDRTAEVNQGFAPARVVIESVVLELRCRVHQPGEDTEGVDRMLGNLVQAVAIAVLNGEPFFTQGSITLTSITQDPTAVAPNPEPSVTGFASLVFTADVVTT
jgi:hypothetical protein